MTDVDRIAELEEIVRAHNRMEAAMYSNSLESSWPKDSARLQRAYEEKYGVDLEGGAWD